MFHGERFISWKTAKGLSRSDVAAINLSKGHRVFSVLGHLRFRRDDLAEHERTADRFWVRLETRSVGRHGLVSSFRVADDIRELLGEERHSSSDFFLVVSYHSPQE